MSETRACGMEMRALCHHGGVHKPETRCTIVHLAEPLRFGCTLIACFCSAWIPFFRPLKDFPAFIAFGHWLLLFQWSLNKRTLSVSLPQLNGMWLKAQSFSGTCGSSGPITQHLPPPPCMLSPGTLHCTFSFWNFFIGESKLFFLILKFQKHMVPGNAWMGGFLRKTRLWKQKNPSVFLEMEKVP